MEEQLIRELIESKELTDQLLNQLQASQDNIRLCVSGMILEDYLSVIRIAEERSEKLQMNLKQLISDLIESESIY